MTPTPTSGAAIQRYKIGYHSYEWGKRSSTPSGIPDASGSWVRYADHVTALAAGQATAAQQSGAKLNYSVLYVYANQHGIDYNSLCVAVREASAQPAAQQPHRSGCTAGTDEECVQRGCGTNCPAVSPRQGVAYAALPDEREMLKHALWLASSFTVHRYLISNAEGRWSGAEKATCHDELCRLYVAVFRCAEVDRVRVDFEEDWVAVHDATQELTDNMDVVIGFPLKGVPDYESLAPKFFAHFHRLATRALRASHVQAPAWAGEAAEHYRNAIARARLLDSDLSKLTERGAKAWAGVDAQGLRDGGASTSANAGQATAAQAVVQDDLITLRKPTTRAEMLWLLKLAHLVISDVDKTLEETFAPAQPAAEASRFGSPELQAMIIARCVEKDQADSVQEDAALWRWLAEYLVVQRTDLDDEIVACETVNDLRKLVEAAIKQGATQ